VQTHLTRLLAELPAHVHAALGTRRDLQLRFASAAACGRAGRDTSCRPSLLEG
jgi:hypothetical protein